MTGWFLTVVATPVLSGVVLAPLRTSQKKAGPPAKTSERVRYIELSRRGMNNAEICRLLGISRKTGSDWRNGYQKKDPGTGVVRRYAPIAEVRESFVSARFLSEQERVTIADLRRTGSSIRSIAQATGRSPSTISRELRRNTGKAGRYRPFHAHTLARNRRSRARPGKLITNPALREEVQRLLNKRWSPGQISHELKMLFPADPSMQLVHETIYRDLYDYRGGGLTRASCTKLRTGRARRKPSRRMPTRRSRFAGDVLMIADRPFGPTDRADTGNWEGDLIMGRHNRSAIGTLVDRRSRKLILIHIDNTDRAGSPCRGLTAAFLALPEHQRRTLTWDQGSEMSRHTEMTKATGVDVYFCDPHSPWQRGSNENANGLLRNYFPKGSDLSIHTPKHLETVAAELNARPRQILNWDTPTALFARLPTEVK